MKNLKTSFLFFYSFMAFLFFISHYSNAQNSTDSTNYYYRAIINNANNNKLIKAIGYYKQKKENDLIKGDSLQAIYDLRIIAIGQRKIGSIYNSENSVVEALTLIDNFSRKDTLLESRYGLYNQLGRTYRALYNSKSAIKSFDEALKIAKNTKDSVKIINNKANVYKDIENYDLAYDLYINAYEKAKKLRDSSRISTALDNIGYTQLKLQIPEALENLKKALEIRLKINEEDTHIYTSYRNLTNYFLEKNDNEQALFYAKKVNEIANRINSGQYKRDALSLILGVTQDSNFYEYKRLSDSISKAKQLADNKNAFMKYNVNKEREKAQKNKLDKEKEKSRRIVYQSIASFIVLASVFIILILKSKHKKEKLQEVYNAETRISKKVHDEVANDLYNVMTKLQSKKNTNEEALDDLESIYDKTRDISKENSSIDVKTNYSELLNDLLLSYKTNNINVITRNISKINWNSISDIKKTTLYRVLQELMTNMSKHSKASLVALTFNRTKDKIFIEYKDNGVGCTIKKNTGLQNVENRIASINGTIIFESEINNGFKAKIIV